MAKKAKKKSAKKKVKKKAARKKPIRKTRAKRRAAPDLAAASCLDAADAARVVFECTGGAVGIGVRLGDLFPSAVARNGFCGCVYDRASGAGLQNPQVPCQESTTIGEVIGALSC